MSPAPIIGDRRERSCSARWAVLTTVVAGSLLLTACGGDDDVPGDRSTTGRPTTETTAATDDPEPTVTVGTVPPGHEQPPDALFPDAATSRRFEDPAAAAIAFAADWVGFTDPVVGEARTLPDDTAEVDVRPTGTGPVTTVSVRSSDDGTWWVTGARTAALQLDSPAGGDEVSPPLELRGRSTAFEGTIDIELRADGRDTPLVQGFVQGGANGEMGPFEGAFPFDAAGATIGAVVLSTRGGEDFRIWEATVARVRFSPSA